MLRHVRFGLLLTLGIATPLTLSQTTRADLNEAQEFAARLTASTFPYEQVPETLRPKVEAVLKQPTTYARGPIEAFPCEPKVYGWLLDHPHHGFRAWKALGVKCATVEQRGDGLFHGVDPLGSEMTCYEILREPHRRVWYAEGTAKPAPIGPSVPVRAVVLLRHHDVVGADGRVGVRHRAEVFAQYDAGRAAKLVSRLWGLTNEAVTRKAAEQIEMFFSGLAWYMSEHPDWPPTALKPDKKCTPRDLDQIALLMQMLAGLPVGEAGKSSTAPASPFPPPMP
jgi:hypothetical protein